MKWANNDDRASWACALIAVPVDAPHELVPSCNRFIFPHWHWPKPEGMKIERKPDGGVQIIVTDELARELVPMFDAKVWGLMTKYEDPNDVVEEVSASAPDKVGNTSSVPGQRSARMMLFV